MVCFLELRTSLQPATVGESRGNFTGVQYFCGALRPDDPGPREDPLNRADEDDALAHGSDLPSEKTMGV